MTWSGSNKKFLGERSNYERKDYIFGVFYIILGTLGLTIPSISYYLTNHRWPLDDISIGLITIVVSTVGYSTAEK